MSEHQSALLCWVALLLYLSSMALQVSGTQRPESQQRESRGIPENVQSYSQGAPLPSSTEFYSKQKDGPDWISVSEVKQRTARERVTGERVTNEIVTSDRVPSEKVPSERSVHERIPTKRAISSRVTSVKAISKRATNDRTFSEKTTRSKATTEKAINSEDAGTLCAYRVVEKGEEARLCFRHTQVDFTCPSSTCRQVRSPGGHLLANMLSNGSVLLQWTHDDGWGRSNFPRNIGAPSEAPGLTVTPTETLPPPKIPSGGQQMQRRGFRMSCWWNGSYTQFECASVILGNSCRDFLLTELHENVPYRICLQPLWAVWDGAETGKLHKDKMKTIWDGAGCVDFSISPSGMQDIVIAMTTVGGAICVMLVIICLLVAYITENIMSPSVQHTLTARHSTRSHNTHL